MGEIIHRFCPRNGLCTIECPHKAHDTDDPCMIEREQIMLYGVVLNLKDSSAISEEYMNEIVYLKRETKIDLRRIE